MTHPTDEELDALVVWLDELPCCHDGPHETSARCKSCEKTAADAITALRSQLADAKAEKEKLGRELNLARYGQPDFSWQVHKEALAEANARADRAEAERAAQIEADAGICADLYLAALRDSDNDLSSPWKSHKASAYGTALQAIRNQPHDRTALDRMLAEAREKVLREADGALETIRVQTGLIRSGCGGVQERLNICCDRIDAAVDMIKGGK